MTSIRKLSAIFRTGSGGLPALPNGEPWLLLALIAEVFLFSLIAPRFLVWTNLIEVLRFSVELGLLSIALTPVLITGGIDLSVGSALGLTTVAVGVAWTEYHLSVAGLVLVGLLVGCFCGALNAFVVAWLRRPALIVTLGTLTLYRGIAEGITHGAASYTGYPDSFLFLGQGYFWKVVPVQLPILVCGHGLLLLPAASIGHWSRSLCDWAECPGSIARRDTGSKVFASCLLACRRGFRPGRHRPGSTSRAGQVGPWHGIRTWSHYSRGAGWNFGLRRSRHFIGQPARPGVPFGASEWHAPPCAAFRVNRCFYRHTSAWHRRF